MVVQGLGMYSIEAYCLQNFLSAMSILTGGDITEHSVFFFIWTGGYGRKYRFKYFLCNCFTEKKL